MYVGALPTPTGAGFTFAGWWTAINGGSQINSNTIINANVTFWARWQTPIVRVVTFNANGGSVSPATRNVNSGAAVGTLPTPTRVGFNFAGWFNTSAATGGTQTTANTVINTNVTFWARWTPIVRIVTFNPNGGSVSPTTRNANNGAAVGALPTPTRAGFNFVGWFNTSAATGGAQFTQNSIIDANTTMWARWQAAPIRVVTFNANGGTVSPTTRNVNSGATVGALPTPTRAGFNFVGWFNTSAATGGTQFTQNSIINANTTMWARWQAVLTRVVTFNANGGTVSPTTQNVNSGAVVGALPTLTRAGFTFMGWFNTNAASGGSQFTQNSIINANTTMWARWQAVLTRVVTFNANGGTVSPTTRNVNNGAAVGTLPVPTRAGFTFVGWYLNPNRVVRVNANTPVNSNMHLAAAWEVNRNPNTGFILRHTSNFEAPNLPNFTETINMPIANVRRIIIHHTAGPPHQGISAIDTGHRGRNFGGIGYHFLVRPDGLVQQGRPTNIQGVGATGNNHDTIHIAATGNFAVYEHNPNPDAPTFAQLNSLRSIIADCLLSFPNIIRVNQFTLADNQVHMLGWGFGRPARTNRSGIKGHDDIEGAATRCPGTNLYVHNRSIVEGALNLIEGYSIPQ